MRAMIKERREDSVVYMRANLEAGRGDNNGGSHADRHHRRAAPPLGLRALAPPDPFLFHIDDGTLPYSDGRPRRLMTATTVEEQVSPHRGIT